MAAPIPPLGVPLANCSYRDFYSTASNDPYNGSYNALLTPYITNIHGGAAQTPTEVADMVYNSVHHHLPTAFIIVGTDNKIHAFHRASKFLPRTGLPPTAWDNRGFVTSGDLFNNSPTTVEWDNTRFHQTGGNLQVPLPDTIDNALAAATPAAPVNLFDHTLLEMPGQKQ